MLSLLLLSLAVSAQAGHTKERLRRNLHKWNSDVACWGAENTWSWHLALYKASEQCAQYGDIAKLVRPVNTFNALSGSLGSNLRLSQSSNPWISNPNVRLLPLPSNPVGQHRWTNLWADFIAGRSKRDTEGLLEFDEEEETQKFIEDYADFKEDLGAKLGNLTCVLTKMNLLDSALQVNLQLYTSGIWENMDLSKTLAGEDPEWRRKLTEGYTDCYQIAHTWPQETLERNPLSKVFGRHNIFFKCAAKVETKMCAAAQMSDWLTKFYGESENFNWVELGLPQDKYERALLTVKVLTEQASPEEKFVDDFFNQEPEL